MEAIEVRLADGAKTSQAQIATPEPQVVLNMRNSRSHEQKHDHTPVETGGFPVHHEKDIPKMNLDYHNDDGNQGDFQDQGNENNQLIDNCNSKIPESVLPPSTTEKPVPDFSFSNYNPLSVTLLRGDHAPHEVLPSLIAPKSSLTDVLSGNSRKENERQDQLRAAAEIVASSRKPAKMFEHFLVLGGDPADPNGDVVPALQAIEAAMPKNKKKHFFGKGKKKKRNRPVALDWFRILFRILSS